MNTLDDHLRHADPALRLRRDVTDALLEDIADRLPAQKTRARRRWWRDWRIALPIGVVSVVALSGAAIVAPLVLGVNGEWVELDARIPITYQTNSGVSVTCEYGLYVSSENGRTADDERLAAFFAREDWTTIGQEIYDFAIANPVEPREGEVWTNDSPETRDAISFKLAFYPVIQSRLPADLRGNGSGWSSTDTCTGPYR